MNNKPDFLEPFTVPNPYNIQPRIQGNENNCTSLSLAYLIEYQLSNKLKERVVVDVDDLWRKQKTLGTATVDGDLAEGAFKIAEKYGVRFYTENTRRTGTYFLGSELVFD